TDSHLPVVVIAEDVALRVERGVARFGRDVPADAQARENAALRLDRDAERRTREVLGNRRYRRLGQIRADELRRDGHQLLVGMVAVDLSHESNEVPRRERAAETPPEIAAWRRGEAVRLPADFPTGVSRQLHELRRFLADDAVDGEVGLARADPDVF